MIDFTKSQQYTLSIRLSTDGFSFSIYNPIHDNSLSTIEKETDTSLSLTANLKATFRESDFLNHSYKRVNIMMADKRFTIVPLELFEEEQAELLFYHNHQKRENETVICNILKKNNVAIIFGMDKSAHTFMVLKILLEVSAMVFFLQEPLVGLYRKRHLCNHCVKSYLN